MRIEATRWKYLVFSLWVGACFFDPVATGPGKQSSSQRTDSGTGANPDPDGQIGPPVSTGSAADGGVEGTVVPLLKDGDPCASDQECRSRHCDGICCGVGAQCCVMDRDCTLQSGGVGRSCDDPGRCRGSAGKLVCNSNRCTTVNGVRDDSACTNRVAADECGLYNSVYCLGGETQQGAPACPTSCSVEEDCDPEAHCDEGLCVADLANGEACKRGPDCAGMYCKNIKNGVGVCCGPQGDCCKTEADCPDDYTDEGVCRDPMSCTGVRNVAQCTNSTCSTVMVTDQEVCNGVPGSACGLYRDVVCMANRDNTCKTSCSVMGDCDPDAFCDANKKCVAKRNNGQQCAQGLECTSGNCQNSVCCAQGGECCKVAEDCKKGLSAQCNTECQGTIRPATCGANALCRYGDPTPDDSGCAEPRTDECGLYPAIACNGQKEQAGCRLMCSIATDCDQTPGVDCMMGQCTLTTTPAASVPASSAANPQSQSRAGGQSQTRR